MQHPDDGLIEEYLDGELASPERAELEAHFSGCAACRERVETSRRFLAEASHLIDDLGEPGVVPLPAVTPVGAGAPDRITSRPAAVPPYRRLAWAATVLLAAGLGYATGTWRASFTPAPEALRNAAIAESAQTTLPPSRPTAVPPTEERADALRDDDNAPSRRRAVAPSEVAPSEFAKSAAANAAPPPAGLLARPPALEDAVRLLGGSIRLIDGMEVEKVEIEEQAVVVLTYRDAAGNPIELRQSRPFADLAREPLAAESQRRLAAADRAARERAAAAPAPTLAAPAAGALDANVMKDEEEDGGLGWTDSAGFRLLLRADADADSLRKIRARIR